MPLIQAVWKNASTPPPLRGADVHIWAVDADTSAPLLPDCLPPAEKAETERFLRDQDQRRAFVSRAFRRMILARYIESNAESLTFSAGLHGKPFLCMPNEHIFFNVSHSKNLVLLAVSRSGELGVDLEFVRKNLRMDEIARRFLPAEVAGEIASRDGEEKALRFFSAWTETEAVLKACGLGLAHGLNSITDQKHHVHHFEPAPGFMAAVATRAPVSDLAFFKWTGEGFA